MQAVNFLDAHSSRAVAGLGQYIEIPENMRLPQKPFCICGTIEHLGVNLHSSSTD